MNQSPRFTVVGAGHGGKAMAAHLALMGFEITLYNRTFDHIVAIHQRGGLDLEGTDCGVKGFARLACVTSDMAVALEHADMVHVVLHPGRTCGAIEYVRTIREQGCTAEVIVAETETFIYASRSDGPAQARIFRVKEAVPLAALPSTRTQEVLEMIHLAYPQFIDGGNVLQTGLNNMGAIFHPALTLLNAGWIESTHGDYQFYIDGVTPSVGRVLEALDRERVTVAASLGIRARTALEWLQMAYNTYGEDLNEAIHNQPGYYGIKAPPTLNHRYIFEDVPMSLVPIASLGQRYGVSVRGMDSIIRLGCIVHRTDYWRKGRTVEKLGLHDLSVSELTDFVTTGKIEAY